MFKGKHAEKVRFVIIPTGDRRKSGIQGQCLVRYPSGSEDYHTCRIDTGANHTVIPEEFWKEHISRADLQRLGHPMTINRLGHQLNGFKLSLSIEISGTDDAVFHRFIECPVVFACGDDLKYVLFGVEGALATGGLCINWRDKEAFFVEIFD